jgi:hypothetical protein
MASQDAMTDDYVAGLLAKDAKESSIKYSTVGLEAFKDSKYVSHLPRKVHVNCILIDSRPPPNKPKPNTRFLRNIIKDTDNHNAALLAKEAAESRSRLEGLVSNEHRAERARNVGGSDIRKRQLGDIAAILGGRPPKRKRDDQLEKENKPFRPRSVPDVQDKDPKVASGQRDREHSSRDEKRGDREETRRHKHRRREDEESDHSRSHKRHRRRDDTLSPDRERDRDHRRRHRSSSRDRRRERDTQRRRRSRSSSPRERRSGESRHHQRSLKPSGSDSPADTRRSHRPHRHSRSPEQRDTKRKSKTAGREEKEEASDSDPLDDIIGPRPASPPVVRARGRGAFSSGSGIDARFSSSYDPTTDVQLDPDEENDWDQALEALRDRQKWHQAGAARLRAAGFTDEEIAKWEKGGEKTEEDVKWVKRGESREWDRGKVIDDEEIASVDMNWGRLKGT